MFRLFHTSSGNSLRVKFASPFGTWGGAVGGSAKLGIPASSGLCLN
jgi:hypothetical protein